MRVVVHRGEGRRIRRRVRESNLWPENDARHPLIAFGGLLHVPYRRVAVRIDDKSALGSEEEEPEHMAARKRRDKRFFRINTGRVGERRRDNGWRCRRRYGSASIELPAMGTAIPVVDELRACGALPDD